MYYDYSRYFENKIGLYSSRFHLFMMFRQNREEMQRNEEDMQWR